MTHNRDLVLIRKLCGLGLPAQTLAPSLLPTLRKLIPSHSAAVFWVDDEFEMTGLYAERLLRARGDGALLREPLPAGGYRVSRAFAARAAASDPVSVHKYTKHEQESAYFRDVLSQLDAYQILYGVLRDRGATVRPDQHLPGRAGSGIRSPRSGRVARPACVICRSGCGRLRSRRTLRRRLKSWRSGSASSASTVRSISAPPDWSHLRAAPCDRGCHTAQGARRTAHRGGVLAPALRTIDRSRWSGAQPLRLCSTILRGVGFGFGPTGCRTWSDVARTMLVSLIGRNEPQALALVRGTGASGLSPQQREVALLVAGGKSNQEIARALSLKLEYGQLSRQSRYLRGSKCTTGRTSRERS